jgi:8-oxo-dGTP pyrophosphatase MutT (NUDIX family)
MVLASMKSSFTAAQAALLEQLAAYAGGAPEQRDIAALFRDFVGSEPRCCERALASGHLTGSAWLVSPDGRRVLLTHHRKLDRWLQPGGHADGDADLARVALREADEETGVPGLVLEPGIFDLDRHWIPERKGEPAHWHYDVRFVVRATSSEEFVVSEESHALAWRPVEDVANDEHADESVRRMAQKWMGRAS